MTDEEKSLPQRLLPLLGFLSLIWFLVRVIPKPSRAAYPCQRAAAPIASSFVLWLGGILVMPRLHNRLKHQSPQTLHKIISKTLAITPLLAVTICLSNGRLAQAWLPQYLPNDHIGQAQGIHPGRVVWVYNPNSTNEWCTNYPGDYWWFDTGTESINNTNQSSVNTQVSQAIQTLTGETSDSAAWESLFRYFNQTHGRGDTGYQSGEKIAIKVNLTSGGWGNVNTTTYEKTRFLDITETSPQLMLAIIDQLVNAASVPQSAISIGDPHRYFFNQFFNKLYPNFPEIHYLDWEGNNGRTWAEPVTTDLLYYSDGSYQDRLPKAFTEANYVINIAALKGHSRAGVTLNAKNHYGSITKESADYLHYALPESSPGFERYRNLVDLMGHRHLGKKTIMYLIDGLWGGEDALTSPNKWLSTPFNDDWPSSLLISQDAVAIESVGFDFLQAEYNTGNRFPYRDGTEDYLLQAADPENWPSSIIYDPDGDGTPLQSLGVFEHWNNAADKLYTRNLGINDGIELISLGDVPVSVGVLATDSEAIEGTNDSGLFTIHRSGDMHDDLTVNFSISGMAVNGQDYKTVDGSVSIGPKQANTKVNIIPLDDQWSEVDENVEINLISGEGYTVNPAMQTASVTISDASSFFALLFFPLLP